MMLLLFLDGLFSYMVTQFACSCGLQTPCLICSRLDHVLGNEKPGFYRDLICISHKSEISSSTNYHVHQKLADVPDMVKAAYFHLPPRKNLMLRHIGLWWVNLGLILMTVTMLFLDRLQLLIATTIIIGFMERCIKCPFTGKGNKDPVPRHCSCCSKRFKKKSHAISLLQSELVGVDAGETGISLSFSSGQNYLSLHNRANMTTDETLGSLTIKYSGNNDFGPLSHIGYSELQVTSDSESNVPLSGDENGDILVHGTRDFKEEFTNRCLQPYTFTIVPNSLSATLSDDQTQEKLIQIDPTLPEASPSVSHTKMILHKFYHHVSLVSPLTPTLSSIACKLRFPVSPPSSPILRLFRCRPAKLTRSRSTSRLVRVTVMASVTGKNVGDGNGTAAAATRSRSASRIFRVAAMASVTDEDVGDGNGTAASIVDEYEGHKCGYGRCTISKCQ